MQSDRKFFACSEYAYIFFCLTEFLLQNIIDTNTHTYRGVGAHAHKPTHICVWLCVLLKLESGGHFLNFSLTWSTMTSQTRVALTPPRLLTRRTRRETPGPVRKLSLTSSYLFFSVFFLQSFFLLLFFLKLSTFLIVFPYFSFLIYLYSTPTILTLTLTHHQMIAFFYRLSWQTPFLVFLRNNSNVSTFRTLFSAPVQTINFRDLIFTQVSYEWNKNKWQSRPGRMCYASPSNRYVQFCLPSLLLILLFFLQRFRIPNIVFSNSFEEKVIKCSLPVQHGWCRKVF